MQKTNFTHLMARATFMLIAMFCFLGEANAQDEGPYGTYLQSTNGNNTLVTKALRPFVESELSLVETKHLVERAPCFVLEYVDLDKAQECANALIAAGATAYSKKMDPTPLPYEYGFENNNLDEEGWRLVDCDDATNTIKISSNTGDYSFKFAYSKNPPQYLISPELINSSKMRVSFWYRVANSGLLETFQLGYSMTTDDINAFTWGDEITASNTNWTKCSNTFPAGTKYVAVRYNSYDKFSLYLDDIKFTEAPAPKTLPYEYGFENNDLYEEGWRLVNCDNATKPYDYDSHTGDYFFRFYSNTYPPQYLISPELVSSLKMRVSFWYSIPRSNYPETFQVGYSTTTDDISAFTWGDEITATNEAWRQYNNIFPAGTKYVAIRYNSNAKFSLYLDDIQFTEVGAPKTLPYEYGFEDNYLEGEGWSLVDCDANTLINGASTQCYSGFYGFSFNFNTNPPQYLISPELDVRKKMDVSFWYRNVLSNFSETFQVGYSTTTNDVSAFTWGDEITASDGQWTQYQNTFPAGTKYVAVRYNSNDKAKLSIDDFSFTEEAAGTKGDVNLDGSVDISDVVLMVNYILGDSSLVNVPLYGDMNDDSSVDISDVVALVNIILGGS